MRNAYQKQGNREKMLIVRAFCEAANGRPPTGQNKLIKTNTEVFENVIKGVELGLLLPIQRGEVQL
jgi:hypothetical protein